jgi:hypothetical protein
LRGLDTKERFSLFDHIKDLNELQRERLFNRVKSGAKLVGKQNSASTGAQKVQIEKEQYNERTKSKV